MVRRFFGMVSAALLTSVFLSAQQPPVEPAVDEGRSDCVHRSIPVTVLKAPSSPWDWHSIKLIVNGKEIPITSFSVIPHAPRVLLMVDTSGSMTGDSRGQGPQHWGVGILAAAFAVDAAPLDSRVSLVAFDEAVKIGRLRIASSGRPGPRGDRQTAARETNSTVCVAAIRA